MTGTAPAGRQRTAEAESTLLSAAHLAWFALVPTVAIVLTAVAWLAPPLARTIYPSATWTAFTSIRVLVVPEPTEQVRYLVALAAPFVAAGLGLAALKVAAGRWHRRRWHDVAVVAVQLGVVATLAVCWVAQSRHYRWFSVWDLLGGAAIGGALLGLALRGKGSSARSAGRPSVATSRVALAVALVLTALWLLPAVFSDATIAHAHPGIRYHLQFTFEEPLAVLNGRNPLADFASQYAKLLPFAVAPVLALLGPSVSAFTVTMGALSLASMVAVYLALREVCDDGRVALGLYLPFLAVSMFTLSELDGERLFLANLYGVIPLRVFGPFVVAWLCARRMRRPPRQAVSLFGAAGLVALNNLEFGLPCFGAVYVGLWCARYGNPAPWRRARALAGQAALGGALSLIAVSVLTLITSSSLPRPAYITHFSRVFGVEGFGMLPMPALGLHVIILLTFVSGLAVAIVMSAGVARWHSPVLTGMLAYSSALGLGAFSYWVGRSAPTALFGTFPTWGFTVSLLTVLVLRSVRAGHVPADPVGWVMPAMATLTAFGLMASAVSQFPSPITQITRLTAAVPPRRGDGTAASLACQTSPQAAAPCPLESSSFDRSAAVRFVGANTSPGETVVILASLGHGIARRGGVVNVSPYSHPDAIVFPEQMDWVLDTLARGGGRKVFLGLSYPEISEWLRGHGFVAVAHDQTSALTEWLR